MRHEALLQQGNVPGHPLIHGLDFNVFDVLPKRKSLDRDGHPARTLRRLDLHAVGEAAFRELHVVVMHEYARQPDLLQQATHGNSMG